MKIQEEIYTVVKPKHELRKLTEQAYMCSDANKQHLPNNSESLNRIQDHMLIACYINRVSYMRLVNFTGHLRPQNSQRMNDKHRLGCPRYCYTMKSLLTKHQYPLVKLYSAYLNSLPHFLGLLNGERVERIITEVFNKEVTSYITAYTQLKFFEQAYTQHQQQ